MKSNVGLATQSENCTICRIYMGHLEQLIFSENKGFVINNTNYKMLEMDKL